MRSPASRGESESSGKRARPQDPNGTLEELTTSAPGTRGRLLKPRATAGDIKV